MRLINIDSGRRAGNAFRMWTKLGYTVKIVEDFTAADIPELDVIIAQIDVWRTEVPEKLVVLLLD